MAVKPFRLRWDPKPPFKKMLRQVANKRPLYNKLVFIMFAMVGEHHRHGGTKQRWARPWRWANRVIMGGWRWPSLDRARITNAQRWATDFYYGHGYRVTQVKAHYRRIRRKTKFGQTMTGRHPAEYVGGKRKVYRTVAITRVRAHNRRIKPRPAHEIWWTRRWTRRAEGLILKHVLA